MCNWELKKGQSRGQECQREGTYGHEGKTYCKRHYIQTVSPPKNKEQVKEKITPPKTDEGLFVEKQKK